MRLMTISPDRWQKRNPLRAPRAWRASSTFASAALSAALAIAPPAASLLLTGCGSSSGSLAPVSKLNPEQVPAHRELAISPMSALNSAADEFGMTMPLDTTIGYFTSSRAGALGKHSIFYSRRTGSTWTVPALAVEINNARSNGGPSITPGGEALYFTGCDYGFGDCDLYRVDVGPRGEVPPETSPWTVPVNLGLTVNGRGWESQPCVAADGSILYFSSDRPDGFGGKDIWYCRRARDGSWERPINAGPRVNTAFDEVSPWVSPDGRTLYFSSNGMPGLGGFDVFEAHNAIGGGTVVQNVGTPINSPSDEITFSLSSDGSHAFVASNRAGGSGGYDLYQISAPPVPVDPFVIARGSVRDERGRPVVATIEVTDLSSNIPLGRFMSEPDSGMYVAILPRGVDYALTAVAPGHLFLSRQLTVDRDLERNDMRQVDFQLQPIVGTVRLLVFFDTGESNLEKESINDLNRAVAFLEANPDVRVEVAGHTDNTGDEGANFELSAERARSVKSFLVGNRINADRIKAVGYGSSQPVADNGTDAGRAMNRRVELRVVRP